jgi:hypothetical protein
LAPSYVSGILRLTLLAPSTVEAVLDGRQAPQLQMDDLLRGVPFALKTQLEHRGTAGGPSQSSATE